MTNGYIAPIQYFLQNNVQNHFGPQLRANHRVSKYRHLPPLNFVFGKIRDSKVGAALEQYFSVNTEGLQQITDSVFHLVQILLRIISNKAKSLTRYCLILFRIYEVRAPPRPLSKLKETYF